MGHGPGNGIEKSLFINGFAKIGGRTGSLGLSPGLGRVVGGEVNDGNGEPERSEPTGDFQSRDSGHADVRDDARGMRIRDGSEEGLGVGEGAAFDPG